MIELTKLIIFCGTLNVVMCDFFHEPSARVINPNGEDSDFGFSMGFQNGANPTLVVSAPTDTYIGKVYTCPLTDFETVSCNTADIDVEKLAESNRTFASPNQKFHLGASIAATSNYFVTCAPLWLGLKKFNSRDAHPLITVGTCFMYNNTAYNIHMNNKKYYGGGIGWNSLADEKNILIARPSSGNFLYMPKTNPMNISMTNIKPSTMNIGYGLASGNFLNEGKMYAFSIQERTMNGRIYFLRVDKTNLKLFLYKLHRPGDYFIDNSAIGSMFGYSMSAADINKDGVSDLIVGAPLFRDDYDRPELGAIHIYVGGEATQVKDTRISMRTIKGNIERGRFGMSIATGDIDGDGIPEIIVSAPYENSGEGAVYILSGHELKKELFKTVHTMHISQLKMTQKIKKEKFKHFGYSLQIIKDIDGNGLDDLAIGTPGNGSVMLFRSLHVINTSMTLRLNGKDTLQLIGDPSGFYVRVCIQVGYKSKNVPGSIGGNSYVTGGEVNIVSSLFVIDLSEGKTEVCNNIEAVFNGNPTGTYNFTTSIFIISEPEKLKNRDFDKTTAVFRPDSETHKSIPITVFCNGTECLPKLSLGQPQWTGGPEYIVGTSENETVSIKVRNDGHSVSTACVLVELQGAGISKAPNCEVIGDAKYQCNLITMRKNIEKSIDLTLDMTNITNINRDLGINFTLYEVCERKYIDKKSISAKYLLDTGVISVTSVNHNLYVTEAEVAETETPTFGVSQEYLIHNAGNMNWVSLNALIEIEMIPYKLAAEVVVTITEKDVCTQTHEAEKILIICTLSLEKKSSTKVNVGFNIPKEELAKFIADGKKETKINSTFLLNLVANNVTVNSSSESIIAYDSDSSLGYNKPLIIVIVVIVALLLLVVIGYVLHRYGFLQTEHQKKLLEAKETVRRKSVKKSNASQDTQPPNEGEAANMDIEVEIQDSVFEDTPAGGSSSRDNHKLIEENAQVHC